MWYPAEPGAADESSVPYVAETRKQQKYVLRNRISS